MGTFISLALCSFGHPAAAAWDLEFIWTTGDIDPRVTGPAAVYDPEQTGSSIHFLVPVQHGMRSYDKDGNIDWTYTGLTLAYDIYQVLAGDLQGTGYNDTALVFGGFNASTGYHIGIVDQDGNEIQRIKLTNGVAVRHATLDGTDIYVASNYGVTRLIKSGSTWTEDWSVAMTGGAYHVAVADTGNGERVYAVSGSTLYSYNMDGTDDWNAPTGGSYVSQFRIGKVSGDHTGLQIVVPRQSSTVIVDKDGNVIEGLNTGTNVRTGVTLYDEDGDGLEEIYVSDMGDDIYAWEQTDATTWDVRYSALNAISQPGLINFDINNDGEDEILAGSDDGSFSVMSADLSTVLFSTSTGHGGMGGHAMGGQLGNKMNGTLFLDVDEDGHEDLVITGSAGYLDLYSSIGLAALPEPPTAPGTPTFSLITETTLRASWTAATDADSYTIERCAGADCSDWLELDTGITDLYYDDSVLTTNTLYRYRVYGTNEADDGPYSSIGEVTTSSTPSEAVRVLRLKGGLKLRGGLRLR